MVVGEWGAPRRDGGGLISFFPSLTREGKANADPGAGVYSCRNGKVVTFPPVLAVRRVDADSEDSRGDGRQTTGADTAASGVYGHRVMALLVVLVTTAGTICFSPHSIPR